MSGQSVLALCAVLGLGMSHGWWPDRVSGQAVTESGMVGRDGSAMVFIPAGPFLMGVPRGARDGGLDEYPNHEVELDAYYIDKYEVTMGVYGQFIRATGHRAPSHMTDPSKNVWHGDAPPAFLAAVPVVNVDWFDARAYCQWAGKRLPTEAEWEKAARGADDRRFPWGDVEPTHRHLHFNRSWRGAQTLAPVGSYPKGQSPYGVHDMAGNVWEWVADWYGADYYAGSPCCNPHGPPTGTRRVVRSSGWQAETPQVRIFTRIASQPLDRNHSTGFRCAADSPTSPGRPVD